MLSICPVQSATAGPSSPVNHKHLWLGEEPHTLHSKPCAGCTDSVTAPPMQAVGNVGVEGIPVELVLKSERQEAMDRIKAEYPNLIMIDYTLPQSVNGELHGSLFEGCCSMHQAAWKCPAAHFGWRGHLCECSGLPALLQCVCGGTLLQSHGDWACTGLFEHICSAPL